MQTKADRPTHFKTQAQLERWTVPMELARVARPAHLGGDKYIPFVEIDGLAVKKVGPTIRNRFAMN